MAAPGSGAGFGGRLRRTRRPTRSTATRPGRTPPTFLWRTADDEMAPVGNAPDYRTRLAVAAVPFALHV
ncbi:MAG: hypothetical protein ACR2F6_04400 [Mycobacteriales bacterium]